MNIYNIKKFSYIFKKLSKVRSNTFEWNYFKELRDPHEILKYCKKHLDFIHQGSSRAAFILTGRFVLKVALNEPGREQNVKEYDVYNTTNFKNIITRVYDHQWKFYWLLVDLVSPLSHAKSGETQDVIMPINSYEEFFAAYDGSRGFTSPYLTQEQIIEGQAFANEQDMPFAEIFNPEQWGKTTDGRIVLIDYGFDHQMAQNYRTRLKKWIPEIVTNSKNGEVSQEEFNRFILTPEAQDYIATLYHKKYYNRSLYDLIIDKPGGFFNSLKRFILFHHRPEGVDDVPPEIQQKLIEEFNLPTDFFTNLESQIKVIRKHPERILYLHNPDEQLQWIVVKNNVDNITLIHNPSEAVKLYCAENHSDNFKWSMFKNPSERIQTAIVTHNPWLIKDLRNPSEAVQLAALNASALDFDELSIDTDEHGKTVMDYIQNPTERVIRRFRELTE